MPETTPRGAPFPTINDDNNPPAAIQALAEWIDAETPSIDDAKAAAAEYLATDPGVADAAAGAAATAVDEALDGQDVLRGGVGDARVPEQYTTTIQTYLRAWVDELNRVALALRADGYTYAPLLAFDKFETDDERLPTTQAGNETYLRAWVDALDRISAAIRADGRFYTPSSLHDLAQIAKLMVGDRTTQEVDATAFVDIIRATVDANGRIAEDVIDKSGRQPLWVTKAQFGRLGTEDVARKAGVAVVPAGAGAVVDRLGNVVYETSNPNLLEAHGDSITQGVNVYDSENLGGWPGRLATDLAPYGITVTNQGLSARTSTELAIRDGVVVPLVTVAGGSIPASGSVAVTITPASAYRFSSSGVWTWDGTLAGVPGQLRRDVSAAGQQDGWTFVRTSAGAATPVAAGTPFLVTAPTLNPAAIIISNYGRNNVNNPDDVIRDTIALRNRLSAARPKMLVLSVLTNTSELAGTTGYTSVTGINTRLAAIADTGLWAYFDVRRWLIDNALTYLGLTPTSDDLAKIAGDTLPPQIMADATHPNYLGFRAMKYAIRQQLTTKGWVPA